MSTLTFHNSRGKYALFLLISVGFVALCIAMTRIAEGGGRVIGWVGAIFFGAGVPVLLRALFDRRPRLVIDAQGVFDRTLGVGVIAWDDIVEAELRTTHRNAFIALELTDPKKYLHRSRRVVSKLAGVNKAMGFAEINLNLGGVDGDPMAILRAIGERKRGRAASAHVESPAAVAGMPETMAASYAQAKAEVDDFAQRLERIGSGSPVTPAIVGANALVYALLVANGVDPISPTAESMLPWGADFGPLTTGGEWWRVLASAFLHFGLLHLALNMWALWSTGRMVERLFGSGRFAATYLFAALTGSLASLLWHPGVVSAGASGAVFGVFGALLAFLLRPGSQVPATILREHLGSTMAFVAYNLVFGIAHPGIDNAAHIGGLAGGFAMGFMLARPLTVEARRDVALGEVGVAAAAGIAIVAAMAWPLVHPSGGARAEMAFRSAVQALETQEKDAVGRLNQAFTDAREGRLDDPALAARLEKDVIPVWKDLRDRLASPRIEDPKLRSLQDAYVRYVDHRYRGLDQVASGIRAGDQGRIDAGQALLARGQEDIEALTRALKDS